MPAIFKKLSSPMAGARQVAKVAQVRGNPTATHTPDNPLTKRCLGGNLVSLGRSQCIVKRGSGLKGLTVWVDPAIHRQLRMMALELDRSAEDMLREAIGDLFQNVRAPPVIGKARAASFGPYRATVRGSHTKSEGQPAGCMATTHLAIRSPTTAA